MPFSFARLREHNATYTASVESLKPALGTYRMAILLPHDVQEQDVPEGTDVRLMQAE